MNHIRSSIATLTRYTCTSEKSIKKSVDCAFKWVLKKSSWFGEKTGHK